ncbi:unnamed protein product [Didymodactylos carnosus]|uniref:Uncharacterized protein n=1 Tax=Didymodactylos carnosus TaxID=1234261 RepID=A0A8S2CQE2_9BILA|nr:unnamed protein product [Didymodactylos carnosus]CAF3494915.1 unnamed protein product [Didymodactylos carnosus]
MLSHPYVTNFELSDGKNLIRSIEESVDNIQHLEYTDIQFEYASATNSKHNNELLLYVSSKSGHVLELSYNEKRVLRIHRLLPLKRPTASSDKIILANAPSIGVNALTVTSNFCITGSNDGYIRVWSNDFQQTYIEAQHDNSICGLAISDDQTRVVVSTVSGSLGVLNLVNKSYSTLVHSHVNSITDIDYDDIRKQMISVSIDGTIRIWSFETGEQSFEFTSLNDTPLLVTYHPNRQAFAVGFSNGKIKVFELNTSIISAEVNHHTSCITGLLYSHNASKLLTSDSDGNLCLSHVNDGYKLQRTIARALPVINNESLSSLHGNCLTISPDGKHTAYIGPTEFVVTVVETNNLSQTLRIDISSSTFNDIQTVDESALLVHYSPSRHLLVATSDQKLLKFDSYTGKLLNIVSAIISCTHKRSFDSLALSSDNQYLLTSGDNLIKFWDYDMRLDINFQSFVGHSESVRKLFFTPDNMNVISVGDSIFIWDVLAWSTPLPLMPNNAQCIISPQSVMTKILEQDDTVNGMPRYPHQPFSYHDADRQRATSASIEHSKNTKHKPNGESVRQFQKRYLAPPNQEGLKLSSIIGYNGNGRENVIWHPHTGLFVYSVGCNVIVENLNQSEQTVLSGHSDEISTLALANDVSVFASAQCSSSFNREMQSRIIIWDVKSLKQKVFLQQPVHGITCMAFSRDDRFLVTVGDYVKPLFTLWNMCDYTNILNWEDESEKQISIHCLSWDPSSTNEFVTGGSNGTINFCKIIGSNPNDIRLHVISQTMPLTLVEHLNHCEITSCVYITNGNLVLCSTNLGFITCWNTRTNVCMLHWKADQTEICYMISIKHKLITGSSEGLLKLWNIEHLESNITMSNSYNNSIVYNETNFGLIIQNELQLDGAIISGGFDSTFDMGIVGTTNGSLFCICWSDRSKTRLLASHVHTITGIVPIEDTHLITSSEDGTIRLWQLDDRDELLKFDANGLKVTCIAPWENAITPTNDCHASPVKNIITKIRSIVAGYDDGTIRLFNLLYAQMVVKLHPHTTSVTVVHVPLNSTIVVSGAQDGTLIISSLTQGIVLRVLNEQRNAPICSIDSKYLKSVGNEDLPYVWAATSHDRRVSIWKSNKHFEQCQLNDWLTFVAPPFAPDGTVYESTKNWKFYPPSLAYFSSTEQNILIYVGYGIEKLVQFYNIETKQIIRTMALSQWCNCFDVSSLTNDDGDDNNHRLIAFGTKERLVQIKDYNLGTFQDFISNSDCINHIKFSKTQNYLYTTSSNEIFIWKVLLS